MSVDDPADDVTVDDLCKVSGLRLRQTIEVINHMMRDCVAIVGTTPRLYARG